MVENADFLQEGAHLASAVRPEALSLLDRQFERRAFQVANQNLKIVRIHMRMFG